MKTCSADIGYIFVYIYYSNQVYNRVFNTCTKKASLGVGSNELTEKLKNSGLKSIVFLYFKPPDTGENFSFIPFIIIAGTVYNSYFFI